MAAYIDEVTPPEREKAAADLRSRIERHRPGTDHLIIPMSLAHALVAQNAFLTRIYHEAVNARRAENTARIAELEAGAPTLDYTAYLPGITDDCRAAIWCDNCPPNAEPIWTDADAAEQVTPISVANYIAICREHEQKHHADDGADVPLAEYGDIDGEDWPR